MTPSFVMLVDDEAPFVETMTKRLKKRELNVISAFSGQEALETLEKHQNFRSLNRNIILIIIIVSVIPLILVGSTIYYQFRASYHAKVYDHLRELVQSHTQNIDSFLQEKLSDIRFLTDSCGRDKLQDEPFLQERLVALQKDFGRDFVDLGVINAAGAQIAYAGPFKLAQADYSDAEWFRKAIQSKYYISDVFLGLRGMPHFIIAVRNSGENGHWILRATIDFVAFTLSNPLTHGTGLNAHPAYPQRRSTRILVRYALLQLPGIALLVLILVFVKRWVDLPAWVAWGSITIWAVKDAILYP